MLQSMAFLVINAEFSINRNYITSALCINRNKPDMHCDGKCFLKKELTGQQNDQTSNQKSTAQPLIVHFFIEREFQHTLFFTSRFLPHSQITLPAKTQFSDSMERPPC